jgi:hypothetical protein
MSSSRRSAIPGVHRAATQSQEGGPYLFTNQSVPIRSAAIDINKKRVREKRPPRPEFPPFPDLPTVMQLTPMRIEALTKRINSARRSADAFRREGEAAFRAEQHWRKCADDIAELLARYDAIRA